MGEQGPASATQRVVVVGGSGFYGRYVVQDVLEHTDAAVEIVCRRPQRLGRVHGSRSREPIWTTSLG